MHSATKISLLKENCKLKMTFFSSNLKGGGIDKMLAEISQGVAHCTLILTKDVMTKYVRNGI